MKTHYELLGLPRTSGRNEIRQAFRREIARYHPDKVQHLGVEFQEIAASRAAALTEAYRVLTHPDEREAYDASLEGQPADAVQPAPPLQDAVTSDPPPSQQEPLPVRPAGAGQEETMNVIRRAVMAKVRSVVSDLGGTAEPQNSFDSVVTMGGRKALFRKPEPQVRVALKILPQVDGRAVEEAWSDVLKLPGGAHTCVMLLGRSLAPSRDLGAAVTALRRNAPREKPVIIPVDLGDWGALLPPDTPVAVRALLDRLKTSA